MWEEERERIVGVLHQVLQQDMTHVFEPPASEGLEDIVKLVELERCLYWMLARNQFAIYIVGSD